MTLEETGTAGRVSNHVESDRIVSGRPVDRLHVVVYRLPGDDVNVFESPHEAHDVALREAEDADGIRRTQESWGFFVSADEAAEKAVELAGEHECIIWDDIVVLTDPDEVVDE